MYQSYIEKNFRDEAMRMINHINSIVIDYDEQGYTMTVRQLYYQLVASDLIPNDLNSYKRIAGLINDGKLAGLIDWDGIEDRTREFIRRPSWDSGYSILQASADSFHMDMWDNQRNRVFVVIEKEALVGVLENTCRSLDVPILAARGYPSGTVLREFAEEDVIPALYENKNVTVLHLGDHDPSGLDMTRDLAERLRLFCGEHPGQIDRLEIKRIALNMEQIQEFRPPPNPAKTTDARFRDYRRKHGDDSWELDALKPQYLNDLVRDEIKALTDSYEWTVRREEIDAIRNKLQITAINFKE